MIEQSNIQAAGGYGPPGGGFGGPPGGAPPGGGYGPPPGSPPPGGNFGGPPGAMPPGGYGGPPPGGFGGPAGFGGPPMGPTMGEPSNGLAIGALVVGILAIPGACCCYSSIPLGIAAIVMSILALGKIKESPHMYGGNGMARAGLTCGIIGLVLTVAAIIFNIGLSLLQQF